MAFVDIYVSGDGNDAASGGSWSARVRSFTRARQLAAQVNPLTQTPRFFVGQFDLSLGSAGINFDQRLGTGIDASDVPDGWVMTAYDPALPWHFRDHRVISATGDFVQVYANAGTYNVAKGGRTIQGMTDNGGTPPSGSVATGIWAVTCGTSGVPVVAGVNDYAWKCERVWRGGNPATLGSAVAFLSSQNPYNELWEATDFTTLGQDGSHLWTQLGPTETWPTGVYGPQSNVIFVYCPKGNPATVWGGITVFVRRAVAAGGTNLCPLNVQNSNGWTIDSSVRVLGGAYGVARIAGNCSGWRLEPRAEGLTWAYGAVRFDPISTNKLFSDFVIAPLLDTKVVGKPYYPIDASHTEGSGDAIQFAANCSYVNGRIAGATLAGEPTFVRDPGHSAVGSVGTTSDINGLVVERDFSVQCGGMQYQRAFVFNGTAAVLRKMVISGRVYNQSAPSQLDGEVSVVGLRFHHTHPLIAAHPDEDQTGQYKGRFSVGQTRPFASTHFNGKNRDARMLTMNVRGRQVVADCTFDGTHGAGLHAQKTDNSGANQAPVAGETLTVSGNTFVNKADRRGEQTAVLVDARAGFGACMSCINNTAVDYPAAGGAQHIERDGYYRWAGPLEALGQPFVDGGANTVKGGDGAGLAINTGWRRVV